MNDQYNLLNAQLAYKPFQYKWAYDAWLTQQQIHWLPEEIPLAEDIKDWKCNISAEEKNLLTQIFRFFTQADAEVNNCYMSLYMPIFKSTEVQMMLSAFSNIETVHIAAYSHLLDTVGMPEVEYQAFLKYKEMKAKHDYMRGFEIPRKDLSEYDVKDKKNIARIMAVFGAFTEGMALFASFAILLSFQLVGKMKGMCQIITWSIRDETLHTDNMIKLLKTFIEENPGIWDDNFQKEIVEICETMIEHEDAFIDLAFDKSQEINGLASCAVKQYVRYIADRRLKQLGINEIYEIKDNPLPWIDTILGAEHTNFFENRVTEYSKSATRGKWEEIFEDENSFA